MVRQDIKFDQRKRPPEFDKPYDQFFSSSPVYDEHSTANAWETVATLAEHSSLDVSFILRFVASLWGRPWFHGIFLRLVWLVLLLDLSVQTTWSPNTLQSLLFFERAAVWCCFCCTCCCCNWWPCSGAWITSAIILMCGRGGGGSDCCCCRCNGWYMTFLCRS